MSLRANSRAFEEISGELLARGRAVRFRAGGRSMLPTIRDGEAITVEPVRAPELNVGDVALYRTPRGIIAHRVVGTGSAGGPFLMRGDSAGSEVETVAPDRIIGRVVAVERGGRSIDPAGRRTKMTNFMLQCASRARRRVVVMASTLLASLALLVLVSAPASGAVAVVTTNAGIAFSGASATYTWSVTLPTGACAAAGVPNYLMVMTSIHTPTASVDSTVFNARTLSNMNAILPADAATTPGPGDTRVQVFYEALQAADCGAAHNMVFSMSVQTGHTLDLNTPVYAGLIVFSGTVGPGVPVKVSAPNTNTTGTGNPEFTGFPVSISVPTPGTTGMVFTTITVDNDPASLTITPTGTTTVWNENQHNGSRYMTSATTTPQLGAASGSMTYTYTWTNATHDGSFYLVAIPMYARNPSLVKERSFTATPSAQGTLVEFKTSHEVSSLGFNLYREQHGQRVKLNQSLLAGSALFAGQGTTLTAGRTHQWLDAGSGGSASYWVEEVDVNGERTWFGPAEARTAPARGESRAAAPQSHLLSHVGREGAGMSAFSASPAPSLAAHVQSGVRSLYQQTQWSLAADKTVKIAIQSEGWYQVAQSDLVAAGLDPHVNPSTLQLFTDGVEQPILVRNASPGKFGPGDSIQFYGTRMDTVWSGTHTYWLRAGRGAGLRVRSANGQGGGVPAANFPFTVDWKPRTLYFPALLNGDGNSFFGPVLSADPVTQSLTVSQMDTLAGGGAQLRVKLQGAASGNHQVKVEFNGTVLGSVTFKDFSEGSVSLAVPWSLIGNGGNALKLTAQGGDSDVSVVDDVQLTYPRLYVSDGNSLTFTLAPGARATVSAFTGPRIGVVDITEPEGVTAVAGTINRAIDGSYTVAVNPQGRGVRTLVAFVNPAAVPSAAITANHPSSWHNAGPGADMVIVSHAQFLSALGPLKTLHESEGLSVALIDVQDLYDEFNYGAKSPYAVRNFLETARSEWRRKPRFLLLAGGASYDPRGYLGAGDADLVPTPMVNTALLKTASDDWYADFRGNGIPQMAVGRLPVQNAAQATALVSRIAGYEQSRGAGWRNQVVLVTGQDESEDAFGAQTAAVKAVLPGYLAVSAIDQGSSIDPHGYLLDALRSGAGLANYFGHGSVQVWGGGLLDSADAAGLTNGPYLPFVVAMTCLNGYFVDDVDTQSLATALLTAPAGGAIAVWASSGLTQASAQEPLDAALMTALYANPSPTLGEAAAAAKQAAPDMDVRRTWILFGDPATKLR